VKVLTCVTKLNLTSNKSCSNLLTTNLMRKIVKSKPKFLFWRISFICIDLLLASKCKMCICISTKISYLLMEWMFWSSINLCKYINFIHHSNIGFGQENKAQINELYNNLTWNTRFRFVLSHQFMIPSRLFCCFVAWRLKRFLIYIFIPILYVTVPLCLHGSDIMTLSFHLL